MTKYQQNVFSGAQEWCQEGGMIMTKTRRFLFEAFQGTSGPQSVPELQHLLAQRKYYPHKTTLYREIERLVERGMLTKVQLSETRISYELHTDHHHHFVCERCQRVTKISFCEQIMKTISRSLGHQGKEITRHTLEFFGVCEFCTKNK